MNNPHWHKMTNTCILYVEDDDNDVFLLQHAFKEAGITNPVRVACDGQEALDYLSGAGPFADRLQNPLPGLILLDIKMPHMSGLSFLEWLRQQPELRKIAVIMYTSSHNDADIERAYELGVSSFIVKPSHVRDIAEMARGFKVWWLDRNQFALVHEPDHVPSP